MLSARFPRDRRIDSVVVIARCTFEPTASLLLQPYSSHRAGQLLEGALGGGLIRPPSDELCAMAEAVAGYVVIAHLDHQLGAKRLPFSGTRCVPAAGPAGRIAGEAGWRHKLFKTLREGRLFRVGGAEKPATWCRTPCLS